MKIFGALRMVFEWHWETNTPKITNYSLAINQQIYFNFVFYLIVTARHTFNKLSNKCVLSTLLPYRKIYQARLDKLEH